MQTPQKQSGLGHKEIHRREPYAHSRIARVTSSADFHTRGTIEVVYIDHSTSFPVWVVGSILRKPEPGDLIIVGYIDGRKDAPFMQGFVRDEGSTGSYIRVEKNFIQLDLPLTGNRGYGRIVIDDNRILLMHPGGVWVQDMEDIKKL